MVDEDGDFHNWNLIELFHQTLLDLPPLQTKTVPAEASRKYISRGKGGEDLKVKAESRNQRLGNYSLRNSYNIRGHPRDIDGGSIAAAMGHSDETHCSEYPRTLKYETDKTLTTARMVRVYKDFSEVSES